MSSLRAVFLNIRNPDFNDGPNSWPHRRDACLRMVREAKADLFGLCEAPEWSVREIQRECLPEHRLIGSGRDADRTSGEWTALYVHPRFEVLDSGVMWLSPTPDQPGSKGWDAALPRIAVWARLREGDQHFAVASTHWDHIGQQARVESARIMQELTPQARHRILMGDFNVEPSHAAFEHFTDAGMRDAIDFAPAPQGTFNAFQPGRVDGPRIDGIWRTPWLKVRQAVIDRTEAGASYASDHFMVWADLEIA